MPMSDGSGVASEAAYPEHEKLHEVVELSQAIGEFLDLGLPKQGIVLAEVSSQGWSDERLVPTHKPISRILADYFGIDQAAIDREKDAMLAALRAASMPNAEEGS